MHLLPAEQGPLRRHVMVGGFGKYPFARRHPSCPFLRIGLSSLVLLVLSIAMAIGHPVAQGSMEITRTSDQIRIVVTVATVDAFVAEAFGYKESATTLDAVWQPHGAYLLDHLEVEVAGQVLIGKVEQIIPVPA